MSIIQALNTESIFFWRKNPAVLFRSAVSIVIAHAFHQASTKGTKKETPQNRSNLKQSLPPLYRTRTKNHPTSAFPG
jgi:hypothetical protein